MALLLWFCNAIAYHGDTVCVVGSFCFVSLSGGAAAIKRGIVRRITSLGFNEYNLETMDPTT